MRITKRPSLSKQSTEAKLNLTATEPFHRPPSRVPTEKELPKLPPIKRKTKLLPPHPKTSQPPSRKETETTLGDSTMFQSMYGREWLRPSDLSAEMGALNLLGEEGLQEVKSYDIHLTEKFEKNIEKSDRLREVTSKWVQVLRKALSYPRSTRASTDKLAEEIRFWKLLSRKFDELQYEFNDERTTTLLTIMRKLLSVEPAHRALMDEFVALKEQVLGLTPAVKLLHLQLEEVLAGFVGKLEQCSRIGESIDLLKKILIGFEGISEGNPLLGARLVVVYDKIEQCMRQKLLATSLYPRQLANISSLKDNYQTIDQALSFYSHFLASLENAPLQTAPQQELTDRAEHSRNVLANLLQILSYFEFLYQRREVSEFSKLFGHLLDYNIYDPDNSELWNEYMEQVEASMRKHNFEA